MSLFNSLGSNYSWRYSLKSLFAVPKPNARQDLATVLGQYYGGHVTLTFKGREALELALKTSRLPAGSGVGINGFTCYAVYEAVVNAGLKPIFIDITAGQLNFGLAELKQIHAKQPNLKAVIVQNTLGYPADMPSLAAYCRQNNIIVIEDLAHSTGAIYEDGTEAGEVGNFTMLSFSQDKPVDSVAGGAMIDRSSAAAHQPKLKLVSPWQRLKLRFYPFWTGIIRSTYSVGLGKIIHFGLKKLRLLATPMSEDIKGLHKMSSTTAGLILNRWAHRQTEISHRQQIANIYQTNLDSRLMLKHPKGRPTFLRFPIMVADRPSLVSSLRGAGIYIGDTWYDAPIGPKRYMAQTTYQPGDCPESEKLAQHIVNLPTHRQVSENDAKNICERIKQWQASQS